MFNFDADLIEWTIECIPEDTPIRGNASAIDDETDTEIENQIIEQLENGNEWAWCIVRVIGRYDDTAITEDDYLGGCSYQSEDDFIQNSGYYDDMKAGITDRLRDTMEDIYNKLSLVKD